MKQLVKMTAVLMVVAFIWTCGCVSGPQTPVTPVATPPVTTQPVTTMLVTAPPMKNIVDTAVADGRFTTLVAAVQAAGLTGTLSGPGPFTVFAPTDDAFKKLPAGTVATLLKDPQGQLEADPPLPRRER